MPLYPVPVAGRSRLPNHRAMDRWLYRESDRLAPKRPSEGLASRKILVSKHLEIHQDCLSHMLRTDFCVYFVRGREVWDAATCWIDAPRLLWWEVEARLAQGPPVHFAGQNSRGRVSHGPTLDCLGSRRSVAKRLRRLCPMRRGLRRSPTPRLRLASVRRKKRGLPCFVEQTGDTWRPKIGGEEESGWFTELETT